MATLAYDDLTLLAVFAHPDDESIDMAGTFARYASEGIRTALVCCTRGEKGGILPPSSGPALRIVRRIRNRARRLLLTPRLGAIREAELRAAAAVLGIGDVRILPYRDSGMGTSVSRHPRRFVNASPTEAAQRLAGIILEIRPHVVITHDERGGYEHPDHIMAHRITHMAIDLAALDCGPRSPWQTPKLYYTARSLVVALELNEQTRARGLKPLYDTDSPEWRYAKQDDAVTARVDVHSHLDKIRAALAAHRSQIPTDARLLNLPPDLMAAAFATDYYVRAFTRLPSPPQEDDLFAGLRTPIQA